MRVAISIQYWRVTDGRTDTKSCTALAQRRAEKTKQQRVNEPIVIGFIQCDPQANYGTALLYNLHSYSPITISITSTSLHYVLGTPLNEGQKYDLVNKITKRNLKHRNCGITVIRECWCKIIWNIGIEQSTGIQCCQKPKRSKNNLLILFTL